MSDHVPSVQSSAAEVWYLKEINFGLKEPKRKTKIITQNFNGPCSFIAICNILILRNNIEILPHSRKTVSYEFLSQLVAEYLLESSPNVDISAALSIMPNTQKGMDLNPLFTGATSFRPAGAGGELKLFEQVRVKLVHGWLVDPESPEASVLVQAQDYDSAVNMIAAADYMTKGQLVISESDIPEAGPTTAWTEEERAQIEDAIIVRRFLDNTRSQLTYYGLFNLASTLEPGSLVALFRSSHLSVLYKSEGEASALYTLVTDHVFLTEPSVVWERLEDVDGGWSTFVDSDLVRSSPAGGDFAGQTAEDALQAAEHGARQFPMIDLADEALAHQLQAEENEIVRRERALYAREQERGRFAHNGRQLDEDRRNNKPKKKLNCIVM